LARVNGSEPERHLLQVVDIDHNGIVFGNPGNCLIERHVFTLVSSRALGEKNRSENTPLRRSIHTPRSVVSGFIDQKAERGFGFGCQVLGVVGRIAQEPSQQTMVVRRQDPKQ
jgi:hypothetical protein